MKPGTARSSASLPAVAPVLERRSSVKSIMMKKPVS